MRGGWGDGAGEQLAALTSGPTRALALPAAASLAAHCPGGMLCWGPPQSEALATMEGPMVAQLSSSQPCKCPSPPEVLEWPEGMVNRSAGTCGLRAGGWWPQGESAVLTLVPFLRSSGGLVVGSPRLLSPLPAPPLSPLPTSPDGPGQLPSCRSMHLDTLLPRTLTTPSTKWPAPKWGI